MNVLDLAVLIAAALAIAALGAACVFMILDVIARRRGSLTDGSE